MKQVTQRLRDGRIEVQDVPAPVVNDDSILVDVRASLLSAGTERTKVEAGRQSLLGKARSRPDQVRQVLDKARRDGIKETLDVVRARLDEPAGIGYSAAGVALEVGSRVRDVAPGDRVACGGGDYAVHAEIDSVPGNLCVPIPDGVSFEHASFATVGSIALHGVRQADARIGEQVAVIGLGLVGQLTAQLLSAAGCRVVGVDLAEELLDVAKECGAIHDGYVRGTLDEPLPAPVESTCDAVIITAGTPSSDPIRLAASLCRDRARIVIVGAVGMELPRAPYYEKELEVRLSRSYGPGRYDRDYEERGLDYPIGYVRWTERRNMAAFLELVADGKLRLESLISERIAVEEASAAYARLLEADRSPLGIVLTYDEANGTHEAMQRANASLRAESGRIQASVVGAGSFAQRVLIPGLQRAGFGLHAVASERGLSAHTAAERFDFALETTPGDAVETPATSLVAIATRHSSHAGLTESALRAGKDVFVEKPPCLTESELEALERARAETGRTIFVGFNRRHAPLAVRLRDHVAGAFSPILLLYRVSAGPLPASHWLNDLDEGGGRLLGEGCHFVDFACWVMNQLPDSVHCFAVTRSDEPRLAGQDFAITMTFADGSLANVLYTASGAPSVHKEYVEAHAGNRSAILDDYRALELRGPGRTQRFRDRGDKGHARSLEVLRELLQGQTPGPEPDHLATMAVTLRAANSAQRSGG